mmetsp:Transcript_30369/g.65710  ORF Transcript_30369/g.65710 Transcript_30369/m.65710 type:complete len:87 (+) Transcript_30369:1039-1299(+)
MASVGLALTSAAVGGPIDGDSVGASVGAVVIVDARTPIDDNTSTPFFFRMEMAATPTPPKSASRANPKKQCFRLPQNIVLVNRSLS